MIPLRPFQDHLTPETRLSEHLEQLGNSLAKLPRKPRLMIEFTLAPSLLPDLSPIQLTSSFLILPLDVDAVSL